VRLHPPRWRLELFDTLPSTSDHCIARAEAGEPEGLAVLARSQTRPRGSRGRSWSQAGGTLAVSVLLRPYAPSHAPLATWPFLAALAFHDALCLTPAHRSAIRLKWPNDVTLDGRKLGGILIESAMQPDAAHAASAWLVIGFGANLASAPDLPERRAACLAELAAPPEAAEIAARLLAALSLWMQRATAEGFGLVREEWLRRAHPPGTKLAVRTGDGQTAGSFCSIAEDGTLLLAVGDEIQRISTGEILFS